MEHTDFYNKKRELQALEQEELIRAIIAHGGSYEWGEDVEKPIVPVNPDSCEPSPFDLNVTKVFIENNNLIIEGTDNTSGNEEEVSPEDVYAGYLSYIIEAIPETETISSVVSSEVNHTGRYVLVHFPKDTSYFHDNQLGYPTIENEDSNALYIPEHQYIRYFGHRPDETELFVPIRWPESQEVMDDPKHETYTELINDEKGLKDFGPAAYWAPLGIY